MGRYLQVPMPRAKTPDEELMREVRAVAELLHNSVRQTHILLEAARRQQAASEASDPRIPPGVRPRPRVEMKAPLDQP